MAKDLPFTDTSMKMGILSVNDLLQIVITEKMVKNGRLSVKCVLITDKSAKNGTLSVNLNEILAESLSSTVF